MIFVFGSAAVLSLSHFSKTQKRNPAVTQVEIIGFPFFENMKRALKTFSFHEKNAK